MPVYASAAPQVASYVPSNAQAKQPTYASLPTDDNQWPLAFRLMSPAKKSELLDPLEDQLRTLQKQADKDNVSSRSVREAKESLENLRVWLRSRRVDLAEGTYDEAINFVRRLDRTLNNMKY